MRNANNFLSEKFLEEGFNYNGTKSRSARVKSNYGLAIDNATATINQLVKNGSTLDQVVTKLLSDPDTQAQLAQFITSYGEQPDNNALGAALQACILRMSTIAQCASMLGTDDLDAQWQVECNDSYQLDNHLPDAKYILSPDVMACINIMMSRLIQQSRASGGAGTMADVAGALKKSMTSYYNGLDTLQDAVIMSSDFPEMGGSNTGDIYDPLAGGGGPDMNLDPSLVGDGTGGISIGPIGPIGPIDPNAIGAVPGGIVSPPSTGSGSGILDFISGLGMALGNLGSGAASGIGAVQGAASNVASQSVHDAIIKNLPLIIGVVIAIIVIILLIVYASKRNK